MIPPLPKTMEELQKTISNLFLKMDLNEKLLLISHIKPSYNNMFMWHELKCSTSIRDYIYMDETFEYCPKLFTQLFYLHSFFAMFIIHQFYFHYLRTKKLFWRSNSCSIETSVGRTKIFGCRFHLTQSWYRKIQKLDLSKSNVLI